jgi:hypothetical protein
MVKLRFWYPVLVAGLLLTGWGHEASAATTTRGPYLQMATPSSIVIRWQTDLATDSVVRYGDAPGNLTSSASSRSISVRNRSMNRCSRGRGTTPMS